MKIKNFLEKEEQEEDKYLSYNELLKELEINEIYEVQLECDMYKTSYMIKTKQREIIIFWSDGNVTVCRDEKELDLTFKIIKKMKGVEFY